MDLLIKLLQRDSIDLTMDEFQYFSHVWHNKTLVPYDNYIPLPNWPVVGSASADEKARIERLLTTNHFYIQDQRILDLGCRDGYVLYRSKQLGANSVYGIDVRSWSIEVANHCFAELNQTNYLFTVNNIEDYVSLEHLCKDKDTIILTRTMQHLKNPYHILEIISNSNVKNLIFQSHIHSDEGTPSLKYYEIPTTSAFRSYDNENKFSIRSIPNSPWLIMILYYMGWKIETCELSIDFNKDAFSNENLEFFPGLSKQITILATKF